MTKREDLIDHRTIVGIIAITLIAVASVVGVSALQPARTAITQSQLIGKIPRQKSDETMKIVPSIVEGKGGSFFIGTGDGGNGYYTR